MSPPSDPSGRAEPRPAPGFTVFFTGLPGAGKSTLASALAERLERLTSRPVTLLDGDAVRRHLSSGLGFTRQDRDLNIRRIGYVASEVTRHGGMTICAAIAPYRSARAEAREMVSQHGAFVEVYVATPVEVCEERDPKGLYAKARAGLIKGFTGVDDPYEAPEQPNVAINTTDIEPEEGVDRIVAKLREMGLIAVGESQD